MTYEDCRKEMSLPPHDPKNNDDLLLQAFFLAGQAQGVGESIKAAFPKKEEKYVFTIPTA